MNKKVVLLLPLLLWGFAAQAQLRQYISLELAGASNGIGLNYDARLKEGSPWAWRAGAGWSFQSHSGLFGSSVLQSYTAPLEVKHIFFRGPSHLELGVGANLGLYRVEEIYYVIDSTTPPDATPLYHKMTEKHNRFGYFLFANVGYRLEKKRFLFRAGITPSTHFGGRRAISRNFFVPYLAFGYRL